MAKRRMFSIDEILSRKLEAAPLFEKVVPKWGYIYFLINDHTIVYVGKAKHYPTRLKAHASTNYPLFHKNFTHYSIVKIPYEQLNSVEREYIRAFRPIHNIQSNGKA